MSLTSAIDPGQRGAGDVSRAIAQALQLDLHDNLTSIYNALPNTSCLRQGYCCSLLPPLAPAEMLGWLAHQAARPGPVRAAETARLVEHFLLNAAVRRPCPWALPRACAIYPRRFLACRTYGLWSAQAYETRRQAAQAAQERVAAAWRGLGIELSPEVLAPGPEYCRHVRQTADGENHPITDADLELAEERLAAMTKGLPLQDELIASGGDASYLVARLTLGEKQCLAAKVEVTRSLLEGRPEQAADVLNQSLTISYNAAISWDSLS